MISKSFKPFDNDVIKNNEFSKFFRNNSSKTVISFRNSLIKTFVSLFYYEKSLLLSKNGLFFNESNSYYLINNEWMEEFKKYYNYSQLYELLSKNNDIYYKLSYYNFENEIDKIVNLYSKTDIMKPNENNLPSNLSNIDNIRAKLVIRNSNVLIYINCYIINSKIFDWIKRYLYPQNFGKNEKFLEPKAIYYKNQNIYIIDNNKIIIGYLNNNLTLTTNYIFTYNSQRLLDREKDSLLKNIDYYIKYRKCDINTFTKQKLQSQSIGEIGYLFIIKNNNAQNNNYSSINNENININLPNKSNIMKFNSTNNISNDNKTNKNNCPNQQGQFIEKNISFNSIYSKQSNNNFFNNNKKIINFSKNIVRNEYKANNKIIPIPMNNINKNENIDKEIIQCDDNSNINIKNELNQKEKELQNQKILIEHLNYENSKLKENINIIQNRLQEESEKHSNINKAYLNQIKDLENNIKEKERLFEAYKNSMEKEKEEIVLKYKNVLKEKEEEIKSLKQNIKLKEKEYKEKTESIGENNKLKEELNHLININEDIHRKLEIFKEENKNKNNEITILNNKNKKYEIMINQLKQEKEQLNKFNNNIQSKFSESNKENEVKNYFKEYNKQSQLINNYVNKIKELEKNIEVLNEKLKEYQDYSGYTEKKVDLINQEDDIRKRNSEIRRKEDEFNKKMNYLEDKEYQIEKDNEEINNQKIKINEIINYNKKLEKELNEIKIKYNQLLSNYESRNSIRKNDISMESSIDADAFIELLNKNKNDKIKNKYKIEPKKDKKGKGIIKLNYINPTLIGLDNIGATCFMNSTLQCLSQTEGLSNYFLNPQNKNKINNNNIALKNRNEHQLSPYFLELINNLWNKEKCKSSYSPKLIINKINDMNPLFKPGQPGDSKDFIIFLLEQLHKELKKPVKKNNPNIKEAPLNQYDKSNAFNHFFSDFKNECSVITDVFFGFIETTNECLNCKNIYNNQGLMNPICFNYQIFNCIIFPLEEVKNMKNNLMKNNNFMPFNSNMVSIYECFYYNQKSDFFTGENRNYCNICKQLYDSIYTNKIFAAPNVLVLILNRGKDNIYDVKLDFSETIDITEFVLQKDIPQIIYNLYGVITHIGQSGPNAHFVASCKSPVDNKWYRYNDSLVNPITNLQKEVIYFGTPYILFYQKNNNLNE